MGLYRDLEKFQTLLLYIGPGNWKFLISPPLYRPWDLKNSDLSSIGLGLGKNSEFLLRLWDLRKIPNFPPLRRPWDTGKIPISPTLYRLWNLEKIRAISSTDMKHVFIAGTWTGISIFILYHFCHSFFQKICDWIRFTNTDERAEIRYGHAMAFFKNRSIIYVYIKLINVQRRYHFLLELDNYTRPSYSHSSCIWILSMVQVNFWMNLPSWSARLVLGNLYSTGVFFGSRG